jgi:hypothetical protein
VETGVTAIAIAPLVPVFLPPFSFQQPALLSAASWSSLSNCTEQKLLLLLLLLRLMLLLLLLLLKR